MKNTPYKLLQETLILIRFYKPTGWILLGLPGSWLLIQHPISLHIWFLWWLGAFIARSGGCIINDWLDRDIDKHVTRTRHRPFARGTLGSTHFLSLMSLCGLLGLGIAYSLGMAVLYSILWIIPWIILYPTAKRWLKVPQLFLAPVFAYSIIVANILAPNPQWILWYAASCIWIIGFDTTYALSDQEDDKLLHIYSAPLAFGRYTPWVIGICYILFLSYILYLLPPYTVGQHVGIAMISILLCSQIYLSSRTDPQYLFHSNIAVGLIIALLSFTHH